MFWHSIYLQTVCIVYFSAGAEGEVIGILEFWVCLHPQVELSELLMNKNMRSVEAASHSEVPEVQ